MEDISGRRISLPLIEVSGGDFIRRCIIASSLSTASLTIDKPLGTGHFLGWLHGSFVNKPLVLRKKMLPCLWVENP